MTGIWQANKANSDSKISRAHKFNKGNIVAVRVGTVITLVHNDFFNSNVLFRSNTATGSVVRPYPKYKKTRRICVN